MRKYTDFLIFMSCIAIWVFALLIMLSSCSPIKRLERMQKRHPTLFDRKNDTIIIMDTVKIEIPGQTLSASKSLNDFLNHDTISLKGEGLETKVYLYNDTVFVKTNLDPIIKEVVRTIEVPYIKYAIPNLPRDRLRWLKTFTPWFLILALSVYIYFKIIDKPPEQNKKI